MQAKTWIIKTISITLAVLVVMCAITYLYDPYCYFRLTNNHLKSQNIGFVDPGIAKNADYDTAIIGSSMTQNFNMDAFRQRMGLNPVKLTQGGMSIEERSRILALVTRTGKAKTLIFNIDLPSLSRDDKALGSFPAYLYDATPFNDYKYLLGYENWMRIMPASMIFNGLDKLGVNIGKSYGTGSIDHIGEWQNDFKFGADILIANYKNRTPQVSDQELSGMKERMMNNADRMIDDIVNQSQNKQVIFFFPPYSALYWYGAEQSGYMGTFLEIKRYIVSKVAGLDNVKIYDFQCLPTITDLNNYKDTSHYSAHINDLMVDYMAEGSYVVNTNSIESSIQQLQNLVNTFTADNKDWLINKEGNL